MAVLEEGTERRKVAGGLTTSLCEMQAGYSQCHTLAEDISPNRVLRKQDMKDRARV